MTIYPLGLFNPYYQYNPKASTPPTVELYRKSLPPASQEGEKAGGEVPGRVDGRASVQPETGGTQLSLVCSIMGVQSYGIKAFAKMPRNDAKQTQNL